MKTSIITILFCSFSGLLIAETAVQPEQIVDKGENIFALTKKIQSFSSEAKLQAYIKSKKPSTFRYFDRLDYQSKKQVFKKHQENQEQDITEIVLQVYRMQARN